MPVYEYACQDCGHRFERRQSFSEPPVKECPECGHAVRKLLSPPGVVFKGSGWYITDSRKPDTTAASTGTADSTAKPETPAKSETPAKTESTSDKKASTPATSAAAD